MKADITGLEGIGVFVHFSAWPSDQFACEVWGRNLFWEVMMIHVEVFDMITWSKHVENHKGLTYQAGGIRVSVHFCAWQSDQIACEG